MIAEVGLFLVVILLLIILLNIQWILQLIRLARFKKGLRGPSLKEVIANSRKDRVLPFLFECAQKYGSRFSFWLSTNCFVFISDPEDAKIVLSSQDLIFKSNNYEIVSSWLGDGLLIAGGSKWQGARKFLTPAFHFNVLKQFKSAMNDCNTVLVDKLSSHCHGEPVNIYPFITLYALDVICETALGVKKRAQVNSTSAYVVAVQGICAIMHHRAFSMSLRVSWIYRFTKLWAEEQKLLKTLHGETNDVIRERREMIRGWDLEKLREETSGGNYEGSKKRLAFLDMLLIAQAEGHEITDKQIREEVDTFMFEGHDTTSSAISFALYLLSTNQESQELAYQEAVEFEGREQENMRYMEAVIKESLRLFPPVPFFSRSVKNDFQLGDLTIPSGATISVQCYSIQRSPQIFPEPLKFRPERYLDGSQMHPFSHIAFSAGPRNCIGQKFAMLEMKSTLAGLLRAYRFKEAKGVPAPIPLAELVMKSENGVHVIIEKRM